jgi:acyl dehydratase
MSRDNVRDKLQFDASGLEKWTDPVEFEVTRERLAAYAAAVNDPIAAHAAGDVANPVFAIVPVFQSLLQPALDVVPLPVLGQVLHGEQDFRFHRPIEAGMHLFTKAFPLGVVPHSTGSTITVKGVTSTPDGEPVVTQFVTVFIRTAIAREAVGEGPPSREVHREGEPFASVSEPFDVDQTFRYMGASGDTMPLHSDAAFARGFGLPGIINHGNCTLAFATRALLEATCDNDVHRLKRLAVRFSRWVTPQDVMTTRIWRAGSRDGRSLYAFESTVATGAPCLSGGMIEVQN